MSNYEYPGTLMTINFLQVNAAVNILIKGNV